MKKLNELIRNPKVRFKTLGELINEYGENWMDSFPQVCPHSAINVIAMYGGKVLYKDMIDSTSSRWQAFIYGPTKMLVCNNMLTTKSIPKYDAQGNVLKPGMLVRIDYRVVHSKESPYVRASLRNEPGTIVKIIKVVEPASYLRTSCPEFFNNSGPINASCILTELRQPISGFLSDIEPLYKHMFIKGNIYAFETAYHVAKATKLEKEYYYKTTQRNGTNS